MLQDPTWAPLHAFPGKSIPWSFFGNETVARMMELVSLLAVENGKIGVECYQINVEQLLVKYNDHLESIGKPAIKISTMYNYLKRARDLDIVEKLAITVETFTETTFHQVRPGSFPSFYVTGTDGIAMAPVSVTGGNSRVFVLDGEITLQTHAVTSKGIALLREYDAWIGNESGNGHGKG